MADVALTTALDNPILNSPYEVPAEYFEIEPNVGPTGVALPGRRPSESFIPVPAPRKGATKAQATLQLGTDERAQRNTLINDMRYEVDLWRARGYPGVTPISRKLMQYWADPTRDNRVLFCQREAAETAIFLAEAAGRVPGAADFRARVDEANKLHNDGLPRVALKMATGSGKTVVMAMLIGWQTINKVFSPNDARFAKRFLLIAPGITIRDRLRVLNPGDEGNYYRQRDLIPTELWSALQQAEIAITNFHTFLLRDAKEIQGVASNTRKILTAGKKVDPFKESNDQMVARVLRDLSGRQGRGRGSEIVVLNDEAHHCYQDKPLEDDVDLDADTKREAAERNEGARVWFKGLLAIKRKVGIKAIYDLSATPFYLSGSGYNEGYIFPWVVSDFSLMDAIESGIVKIPRVPVDDDATSNMVSYLRLWDHVGKELPKARARKEKDAVKAAWVPPATLEGAMRSLYRSYSQAFDRWATVLAAHGEMPPVFIVVCPNTAVSKLVYEWIAGTDAQGPDGIVRAKKGQLELLSNVDEDGRYIAKPRTILVDSAQLESGEAMKQDFKDAAGHEIEQFKDEYRNRFPGADVDKLTDEDLLREVMNTVGKPGRLGEGVRCVVSVSMLTEGWDANTVTHILGIRRFGSQLLCEQVVGRGLRRRSYDVNEQGRFEPEYAEVYGVPFQFIGGKRVGDDKPKLPTIHVRALPEQAHLRIEFPILAGYRVELFDEPLQVSFTPESRLHVDKTQIATFTQVEGIVGEKVEHRLTNAADARSQKVAFAVAKTLVERHYAALDDVPRPWLFPRLLQISKQWLDECVTYEPGTTVGHLVAFAELTHKAAERVHQSIVQQQGNQRELLTPVMRDHDNRGSTDGVTFFSRKHAISVERSHVSHVVLDGPSGNTWEETIALLLDEHPHVTSFVKNDHLGFEIPYVHAGVSHRYLPDFLVRLSPDESGVDRTLIVEVSGGRKSPGPTNTKAQTARDHWCRSVNNHGGFGRWAYVELTDMTTAHSLLNTALADLYADGFMTGLTTD